MRNFRKHSITVILVILLICALCQPALAITEEEVQAQIDANGKEAVSGNVFIWFLCAIAFLKVSQKIDSFMASLGINVGNTSGSMLAELMFTARGISGVKNIGGKAAATSSTVKDVGAGFLAGGLAGAVGRKVASSAVKSVTTSDSSESIGARVYNRSVEKSGDFANKVIGTVAMGNISQMGSITGEKAETALRSYMPTSDRTNYSNVEIGGGRIMGTETSPSNPDGVPFGMYSTKQYTEPKGDYTTVTASDGSAWYKQYAQNGTLPEIPKRKDKI